MAGSQTYRFTLSKDLMSEIDEFARSVHIKSRAAAISILCTKALRDVEREYGVQLLCRENTSSAVNSFSGFMQGLHSTPRGRDKERDEHPRGLMQTEAGDKE